MLCMVQREVILRTVEACAEFCCQLSWRGERTLFFIANPHQIHRIQQTYARYWHCYPAMSCCVHCCCFSSKEPVDHLQELGKELLRYIVSYTRGLQHESAPVPSLLPSTLAGTNLQGQTLRDRTKVIELAQRIVSTTMDPGTSLLVDTLQVRCAYLLIEAMFSSDYRHSFTSVRP